MTHFLQTQDDFVLLLTGLAFLLLGVFSLILEKVADQRIAWKCLGIASLFHTLYDWSELLAEVFGDEHFPQVVRVFLHVISLLILLEFNRRSTSRLAGKHLGLWVYPALLVLPVAAGLFLGPFEAKLAVRFQFAIIIAFWTCWVLVRFARCHDNRSRPTIYIAAIATAFYVLAGIVLPKDLLPPGFIINTESFASLFIIPVLWFRMLMAGLLAVAVWKYLEIKSIAEYKKENSLTYQRYFHTVRTVIIVLLLAGWWVTEKLGHYKLEDMEHHVKADLSVTASLIRHSMESVDITAQMLSEVDEVVHALQTRDTTSLHAINDILKRINHSISGDIIYLMDKHGTVLATSNHDQLNSLIGNNYDFRPYFKQAMQGKPANYLARGITTNKRGYYSSNPVFDDRKKVSGVIVIKKGLEQIDNKLDDHGYNFLVSPDGIIFMSSQHELLFHSVFPIATNEVARIRDSRQFGDDAPRGIVLSNIPNNGEIFTYRGNHVIYQAVDAYPKGWSLISIEPIDEHLIRFLGILLTLFFVGMVLAGFAAIYMQIHDADLLHDAKNELQALNEQLETQAHTDILTGVFNRLMFNNLLKKQVGAALRYQRPLSLIMFDIDHFKQVNDTYGHLAGDEVLKKVANLITKNIRQTDYLARWGGEEFMILMPETALENACVLAEKLRQLLSAQYFDGVGTITCSFGVAELRAGEEEDAYTKRVDCALYQAKETGRNRVIAYES